ncbi:hypothetical protein GGR56DRAFT_623622 [Xylariaceae sp. FL0804]|nr:hypothetical protein GGR56DRAFT_623622 [Xylariaceae sp. FL0804]
MVEAQAPQHVWGLCYTGRCMKALVAGGHKNVVIEYTGSKPNHPDFGMSSAYNAKIDYRLRRESGGSIGYKDVIASFHASTPGSRHYPSGKRTSDERLVIDLMGRGEDTDDEQDSDLNGVDDGGNAEGSATAARKKGGKKAASKATGVRATHPRISDAYFEWRLVPVHGQPVQAQTEDHDAGEPAKLGPFPFAPGSPKPDFDQDVFILDRTALASVGRAADRGAEAKDVFAAKHREAANGAAVPQWVVGVRNILFNINDVASQYQYYIALVQAIHPAAGTKGNVEELKKAVAEPKTVGFFSSPERCSGHRDCDVHYDECTKGFRVAGVHKIFGADWWAFANFCFRREEETGERCCLRSFPHAGDQLVAKQVGVADVLKVMAWNLAVLQHGANIEDLREEQAGDAGRILDIKFPNSKHVMAKLIVRQGCNTEAMLSQIANFENFGKQNQHGEEDDAEAHPGHPLGHCPVCTKDFYGDDYDGCVLARAASLLPATDGGASSELAYMHFGCRFNHIKPCNRHGECEDDRVDLAPDHGNNQNASECVECRANATGADQSSNQDGSDDDDDGGHNDEDSDDSDYGGGAASGGNKGKGKGRGNAKGKGKGKAVAAQDKTIGARSNKSRAAAKSKTAGTRQSARIKRVVEESDEEHDG